MPIQQMLVGIGKSEVFAEATGGTVTTVGDYKVHAFTSSGTFTVTQLADTNEFETLVVAGGAGPGILFLLEAAEVVVLQTIKLDKL